MNENIREKIDANVSAWKETGDQMSRASALYLMEMRAYMEWSKNFQKEVMDYYWAGMRLMTNVGRETTAFVQRIYETTPSWGQVPKGTETISGMVNNIVKETRKEE
jgi:hypothetical protein